MLALADPKAGAAADELNALDAKIAECREAALSSLAPLLEDRSAPRWELARKTFKELKRNRSPAEPSGLEDEVGALRALADLEATRARQAEHLERALARELEHSSRALDELADDPLFREALTWQNRNALYTGIDRLRDRPPGRLNRRDRKRQHLAASYLQRYCVKNDTIGFFGPVGSATIAPDQGASTVRPGPSFLAKRTVYFEHWGIDALARALAQDPALRPYLRPRRMPIVRIDRRTIHYGIGRQSEIPLPYVRLLQACDGNESARQIARDLLADDLDLDSEEEVFDLLEELEDKGLCTWTLEIPTSTVWPEDRLRELLEQAEGSARDRALGALRELEAKRDGVARAVGRAEELGRALTELETTFEALTSESATRRNGESYAGRTLVYEDCRRDLDVRFGADFLRRLGPPLSLVLQSARWYTHRIAEHFRQSFEQAFAEAAGGASAVDYLTYWQHLKHCFPQGGERPEPVRRAAEELQAKWAAIVDLDPDARRVELNVEAIAPAVEEAFAAPHPGWPSARYHSPDVMLAASSADAVEAGEGLFVLGEVHPSVNTVAVPRSQKEHEDPDALMRARDLDLPEVLPFPVIAREHFSRADHIWFSEHHVDLEFGTTRSWRPREHVIAVGTLIVERQRGHLVVRDRDRRWQFDITAFYDSQLSATIATEFTMFPLERRMPRISFDDLVVAREQWRFSPEELTFTSAPRGQQQFAAARRWAHEHGLPRWLFVKVPEEPKPVYVDFDSPIYVELLAKLARKASSMTASEMLPTVEESWLPDAGGRTYTSELRLVSVDPRPWRSPVEGL